MTIHELIAQLQKLDPNFDIYIPCPHCCRPPCIDLLTDNDIHADHIDDGTPYVLLGSAEGDCIDNDHLMEYKPQLPRPKPERYDPDAKEHS